MSYVREHWVSGREEDVFWLLFLYIVTGERGSCMVVLVDFFVIICFVIKMMVVMMT